MFALDIWGANVLHGYPGMPHLAPATPEYLAVSADSRGNIGDMLGIETYITGGPSEASAVCCWSAYLGVPTYI